LFEDAFFRLEEKVVLVQFVEDLVYSRSMVWEVQLGVYEDVVHVD
jgi:hypothetical protein